jgi:hypothetical protein
MNEAPNTLAAQAANWLPDALMTAGAGAASYGAWMVYPPAGFIVGGLFGLAAGWILARGGK